MGSAALAGTVLQMSGAQSNHSDRNAVASNCRNKVGGKIEGARKTTSTLGLRTPSPGASQISAAGASISAKSLAAGSDGARLSVEQAAMTPTR